MIEKEFFMNLLNESKITSPKRIEDALFEKFEDAVNIDWYLRDEYYEAVFYSHSVEHIAKYDLLGKLIHYKINLPINKAPLRIKQSAERKGEIMNVVEINRATDKLYEIIVRSAQLKRSLLLLDMQGGVIEEKEL